MGGRVPIPMTDKGRDALIGISFLCALFGFVVFFRLLGRWRGIGFGLDDILAVVAFILSASTIGFNAAVFSSGVGYNLDPDSEIFPTLMNNLEFMLKITFIFTLVYLWTLTALKLSQLWFYLRAFSLQLRSWILAQWTLMRTGRCLDQILVLKCIIMTNILTDLMIVVLPVRTVWKLQMRITEKVAVLGCFAIGLACVSIGIVRFWQMNVIDLFGNFTGTSFTTFMLCTIELMLAGICINIPMLRPFYLRWRHKYKSSNDCGSYPLNNSDLKTIGGTGDPTKRSGKKGSHAVGSVTGNYTAWIELDDKEHEAESNVDNSSQRELTAAAGQTGAAAPSGNSNLGTSPPTINVSTKWTVTRD
ncbi:hypothetical protein QBC35DRAFT_514007 [Podospora australis]|uniref:Rhodopsin domain-containing protein n=1 Tax=Podospora australis TaxID=1536484 RepID=A0AAN6WY45_9PEZI|nr:hypothetical protein QBC35DRAFT_514007 [Podospora australis]